MSSHRRLSLKVWGWRRSKRSPVKRPLSQPRWVGSLRTWVLMPDSLRGRMPRQWRKRFWPSRQIQRVRARKHGPVASMCAASGTNRRRLATSSESFKKSSQPRLAPTEHGQARIQCRKTKGLIWSRKGPGDWRRIQAAPCGDRVRSARRALVQHGPDCRNAPAPPARAGGEADRSRSNPTRNGETIHAIAGGWRHALGGGDGPDYQPCVGLPSMAKPPGFRLRSLPHHRPQLRTSRHRVASRPIPRHVPRPRCFPKGPARFA